MNSIINMHDTFQRGILWNDYCIPPYYKKTIPFHICKLTVIPILAITKIVPRNFIKLTIVPLPIYKFPCRIGSLVNTIVKNILLFDNYPILAIL